MMKLGYARVSTNEQDTAAQVSALKSAGCEKIFERRHLAEDGTDPNPIACWINYERAMFS
jgi:DNA invertase Pin-like site-specific DNA recombinase